MSTDGLTRRYATCIEASRRVRWEIERDLVRGRELQVSRPVWPDAASRAALLALDDADSQRSWSCIRARSCANLFALFERCLAAIATACAQRHAAAEPVAFEALVRMADESLKHRSLFHRLDSMLAEQHPVPGYRFDDAADRAVASLLGGSGIGSGSSGAAVLAFGAHVAVLALSRYRSGLDAGDEACPLARDVALFHWKEKAQHAVLCELEWRAAHERANAGEREDFADELIARFDAVDRILRGQAEADARCLREQVGRTLPSRGSTRSGRSFLAAYRWQALESGWQEPRFAHLLAELGTPAQRQRIASGLSAIVAPMR